VRGKEDKLGFAGCIYGFFCDCRKNEKNVLKMVGMCCGAAFSYTSFLVTLGRWRHANHQRIYTRRSVSAVGWWVYPGLTFLMHPKYFPLKKK
jgi:hypothetical protein